MPILVTGLSGFVGSFCAEQFAAVDLSYGGRVADVRVRDEVRAAIGGVKPYAVIHLAGQSSVPASIKDPADTYRTNFEGTLNLLLALNDCGFRGRLLYVGTADGYGNVPEATLPVTEDIHLRPLNPYAASKTAAEALCHQWSQTASFDIVMARPFNHIGPRQSTRFAVADFARQITLARKGLADAVLKVGDIDTTRDFTDVRDIVRAYVALLQSGQNGHIYNVCSGVERSLRQVINALCLAGGVRMNIEVDIARFRAVEQRRMCGSFEKLNAQTGWRPTVAFEQTIQDILNYWANEREL